MTGQAEHTELYFNRHTPNNGLGVWRKHNTGLPAYTAKPPKCLAAAPIANPIGSSQVIPQHITWLNRLWYGCTGSAALVFVYCLYASTTTITTDLATAFGAAHRALPFKHLNTVYHQLMSNTSHMLHARTELVANQYHNMVQPLRTLSLAAPTPLVDFAVTSSLSADHTLSTTTTTTPTLSGNNVISTLIDYSYQHSLMQPSSYTFKHNHDFSPVWIAHRYLHSYYTWLRQTPNRQRQVKQYADYLRKRRVGNVLPMPLIISSQRDAFNCKIDPWVLPPSTLWPNLVNTLDLVATLQKKQLILPQDVISSVYRGTAQNHCAKGATKSKHLENYAIDIELQGNNASNRYKQLCQFWRNHGQSQQFGLGTYTNTKIHIDSAGYRTWGLDYTRSSSQC